LTIPPYYDIGGNVVTPSLDEPSIPTGKTALTKSLVSATNTITINPSASTEIGTHIIKIILTDNCGVSISNDLTVNVLANTSP
jgi:hypothetical protein